MTVWINRNITQIRKVACLDQQPSKSQHVKRLRYGSRHTGTFNHHIGAPSMREVTNSRQALAQSRMRRIQSVIRTKTLGKIETIVGKINRNDHAGPQHSRLGDETHAQRPHSQDYDGIVETK